MGWLAPGFLAGLLALGLPLWLHLLRRYRDQPRPFSSLMFFEPRTQSSILHRRLRYLLLLALRLATLALLALAFANPFVSEPAAKATERRLLVVAVDDSFSMRYGDHMEEAKRRARGVLDGAEHGRLAMVAAFDTGVDFVAGPSVDRNILDAGLGSIAAGDEGTSFGALARALRGLAAAQRSALDVHVISDMQKAAMPPAFADLELPAGSRLTLDAVGKGGEANWTVESVNAPTRVFDGGKKTVSAVVAGYNTAETTLAATLALDGRVLETKTVTAPAGGRATVEFTGLETPYGFHRGEVRINAADELTGDNRYPFAVERLDPRPVLLFDSARKTRAALYLHAALEAADASGFQLEERASGSGDPGDLSRYAFVMVLDPGRMPARLEAALDGYVKRGGAVFLTLGAETLSAGKTPLTGHVIRGAEQPGRGETFETAAVTEPGYPALKGLTLEGVKFYEAAFTEAGNARVAARLGDHTPLLMEDRIGEGKVVTFASALDNVANDFPLKASFVAFVQQMADYLGGAAAGTANLTAGTVVDLHGEGAAGAAVDVTGPDGKRALSLTEAAALPTYELKQDGFYEIRAPGGRRRLLAVHADRRESDLTRVPEDTLALWAKGNSGDAPAQAGAGEPGEMVQKPLGRYLLVLALLAAVSESLFSVRYLWNREAA